MSISGRTKVLLDSRDDKVGIEIGSVHFRMAMIAKVQEGD